MSSTAILKSRSVSHLKEATFPCKSIETPKRAGISSDDAQIVLTSRAITFLTLFSSSSSKEVILTFPSSDIKKSPTANSSSGNKSMIVL